MLALFASAFALGLSSAGQPAPYFYDEVPASAKQVGFDFARSCRVEGHDFFLEKDRLADVIGKLGRGKMKRNGEDAAGGEVFVDFAFGPNLVRFSSNCEMGGNDLLLDGVEVREGTVAELKDAPRLASPIVFIFGHQGMSIEKIRAHLGSSPIVSGKAYYVHAEQFKPPPSDFEVDDTLIVTFRNNVVTAIKLTRVTSN